MNEVIEGELWEHMERTMSIATSFGEYLSLDDYDLGVLSIVAKYHDIGKVLVGNEILKKKNKLSKEDIDEIKMHPEYSLKLLLLVKDIDENILKGVYEHHERVDSKGYPNNLSGDEISSIAKIISLCDSYDAMTTERVYKKALTKEEAIVDIYKCLGTQFDKELGELFIDFLKAQ